MFVALRFKNDMSCINQAQMDEYQAHVVRRCVCIYSDSWPVRGGVDGQVFFVLEEVGSFTFPHHRI